jgi:glycosyltransferase involved in cell wall biosynthesis
MLCRVRVCIDIQAAVAQRAGVGRYTKMLAEHLAPLAADDQLALFHFDFAGKSRPVAAGNAEETANRWLPRRWAQQCWNRLDWPPFDAFAGPADLYHFPNFIRPPLRQGKSIVTIHDVSFLRHPETVEEKNQTFLSRQMHNTVERADAIITVSNFVADEVRSLLAVPEEKLFPIHLGLKKYPESTPQQKSDFQSSFGLDRPYLLHVGTIEPRKNHQLLVEIFERLDFDGDLVLAGMKGWKCGPIFERIRQSPAADRIRYIDYLPEDHLGDLYRGAEAFVFPSIYEGFGLPPLEAMLCGVPVISSSAGSLREVLGNGARLVDGDDPEDWINAVSEVLNNPTSWIDAGESAAAIYRWETTAEKTWEVYRQVAG